MRAAPATLFAMLAAALGGCLSTSSTTDGSCASLPVPQPSCFDYDDIEPAALSTLEQRCDDSPVAQWSNKPCSREGALGGCSTVISGPDGSFTQVTWYYAGDRIATTADVMAECVAHNETFVAP